MVTYQQQKKTKTNKQAVQKKLLVNENTESISRALCQVAGSTRTRLCSHRLFANFAGDMQSLYCRKIRFYVFRPVVKLSLLCATLYLAVPMSKE